MSVTTERTPQSQEGHTGHAARRPGCRLRSWPGRPDRHTRPTPASPSPNSPTRPSEMRELVAADAIGRDSPDRRARSARYLGAGSRRRHSDSVPPLFGRRASRSSVFSSTGTGIYSDVRELSRAVPRCPQRSDPTAHSDNAEDNPGSSVLAPAPFPFDAAGRGSGEVARDLGDRRRARVGRRMGAPTDPGTSASPNCGWRSAKLARSGSRIVVASR